MMKYLIAGFFLVLVGIYATNPMFKDPQLIPPPQSYDSIVKNTISKDSVNLSKFEPKLDSLVNRFDKLYSRTQRQLNP